MKTLFSGARLREMRQEVFKTQQELAYELNITPRCLYSWESGITYPSAAQLGSLAKALKAESFESFYV